MWLFRLTLSSISVSTRRVWYSSRFPALWGFTLAGVCVVEAQTQDKLWAIHSPIMFTLTSSKENGHRSRAVIHKAHSTSPEHSLCTNDTGFCSMCWHKIWDVFTQSVQSQSHLFALSEYQLVGFTSGVYASGRCDSVWTDFTPGIEMHFNNRSEGSTFCLTSIFPTSICHMFPCASPSSLRSRSTHSAGKSMNPQRKPIKWKLT